GALLADSRGRGRLVLDHGQINAPRIRFGVVGTFPLLARDGGNTDEREEWIVDRERRRARSDVGRGLVVGEAVVVRRVPARAASAWHAESGRARGRAPRARRVLRRGDADRVRAP